MFPGYGGEFLPYRSPIFLRSVERLKTGAGVLRLTFVNVGYTDGVQEFDLRVQVVGRTDTFLIGQLVYDDPGLNRWAVIGEISFRWIEETGWARAVQRPDVNQFDVQQALTEWWFRE
jgi:hypothetical protein